MHYIVCVLNSGSVGYLIDTTVEKSVQEFEFDSEKLFVAKGCGSLLATGGEERELQVWDLNALITSNTMNCLFKAKNVKTNLYLLITR